MELNRFDTLLSAINDLKGRGFNNDFNFKNGKLHVLGTDITFSAEEIKIVAFHRFEGDSNADDMAVVYAVESKSGLKGTIVDAYGAYADRDLAEFIKNVKVEVNR